MKKKLISRISHLLLFIVIELLFVFLILRELPSVSLFSLIWIVHLVYRASIILAGIVRESLHKLRQKIIASYFPILLHVAGHILVIFKTVEHVHEHSHEKHNIIWLIVTTISVGALIVLWEWLLHRKIHCDHCHHKFHEKECDDVL